MLRDKINNSFHHHFPFDPTPGQEELMRYLSDFLSDDNNRSLFILKGYAGTGKTTLVSTLVKLLPEIHHKSVLMAPTGRAAKVLSAYSGKAASTIHRRIYFQTRTKSGAMYLKLQENLFRNAIFLVDEASMITGDTSRNENIATPRNLLDDLFEYVYSNPTCRMILIGDTAQLPPVGTLISPALDREYLNTRFNLKIYDYELTDVMRQSLDSGILSNATSLRNKIKADQLRFPLFSLNAGNDFENIMGSEFEELLQDAYAGNGRENSIIVTRSNKRANMFNQEIRKRILYREYEIESGDYIMVVKNNYFWLQESTSAGFIANGDIIEVLSVRNVEPMHGFRFADISFRMVDYPDEKTIDAKIILDTIEVDGPSLSHEQNSQLYHSVLADYQDIPERTKRNDMVRIDPYFNALQVKFAYAMTCHKTQGGQWSEVFIDKGFMKDAEPDLEYLRWLYTAVTRATEKVYLLQFDEKYFG